MCNLIFRMENHFVFWKSESFVSLNLLLLMRKQMNPHRVLDPCYVDDFTTIIDNSNLEGRRALDRFAIDVPTKKLFIQIKLYYRLSEHEKWVLRWKAVQ